MRMPAHQLDGPATHATAAHGACHPRDCRPRRLPPTRLPPTRLLLADVSVRTAILPCCSLWQHDGNILSMLNLDTLYWDSWDGNVARTGSAMGLLEGKLLTIGGAEGKVRRAGRIARARIASASPADMSAHAARVRSQPCSCVRRTSSRMCTSSTWAGT